MNAGLWLIVLAGIIFIAWLWAPDVRNALHANRLCWAKKRGNLLGFHVSGHGATDTDTERMLIKYAAWPKWKQHRNSRLRRRVLDTLCSDQRFEVWVPESYLVGDHTTLHGGESVRKDVLVAALRALPREIAQVRNRQDWNIQWTGYVIESSTSQ